MRMTSLRVPTSAALFLGLLLAAPIALADQKDDLLKKAKNAENSGDLITARDSYCALPADFNDAGTQCNIYKDLATKAINKSHINFAQGVTLLDSGKFDEATIMFRNVKVGPDVDAAKQKLAEIPGLKAKAAEAANAATQNAAAEQQMKARFDQGMGLFGGNDFAKAEGILAGVTGSHQAEAQATVNKIRSYNAKITEAQQAVNNKNYAAAVTAYGQAIAIVPNGPGNPQGEMAKAVQMASASAQPVNPPTTTATVRPPTPVRQIDVAAYLRDGQKALAKKDYKKAKRFFQEVLGQDASNQDAKDALAQLNTLDTSTVQATDDDPQLSRYIGAFYSGQYAAAEQLLNQYIFSQPKGKGKLGLANFYLGASMMTRYYLAGANDPNLKRDAQSKFKEAKGIDGFKAPEKFVSPKIMKAFEEAS
jgi:hypothetical protein